MRSPQQRPCTILVPGSQGSFSLHLSLVQIIDVNRGIFLLLLLGTIAALACFTFSILTDELVRPIARPRHA
jgi:hypothetical protein